jgi:uncharacterized lipoprotein YajG
MIDMKIVILAAAAFVAATCSAPAQTSVVAAEANEGLKMRRRLIMRNLS